MLLASPLRLSGVRRMENAADEAATFGQSVKHANRGYFSACLQTYRTHLPADWA